MVYDSSRGLPGQNTRNNFVHKNLPDLPDATVTVAHDGQTGLKVFLIKNLFKFPIYPQVAINFVLKNVK